MTKAQMIQALTGYYPLTTSQYWQRHSTAVVELNYRKAVEHYGLLPVGQTPSPQTSIAATK